MCLTYKWGGAIALQVHFNSIENRCHLGTIIIQSTASFVSINVLMFPILVWNTKKKHFSQTMLFSLYFGERTFFHLINIDDSSQNTSFATMVIIHSIFKIIVTLFEKAYIIMIQNIWNKFIHYISTSKYDLLVFSLSTFFIFFFCFSRRVIPDEWK